MRLHRFIIEEKIGEALEFTVTDQRLLHQWSKVFRFEKHSNVIILDNSGFEFTCTIDELTAKHAILSVTHKKENKCQPKREIYLFASVVKKDTFEWILEKGTELGVSRFVPILSDRSEKKGLNFERTKIILKEATEQSGRAVVPRLYEIMKFEHAIKEYSDVKSVAWDPQGTHYSKHTMPDGVVGIYIGPEGGWSEREIELFKEKNIPILSVGEFTLRAETAAVAILSLLLL